MICLLKTTEKKMIDKWIYGFFSALDKIGLMVDNLCQRMTRINMNYYFTGLLIVMLVILAFCGGPSVQ